MNLQSFELEWQAMDNKQTISQEVKRLQFRIKGILPLAYHACMESVSPTSMGSAGLKYSNDGKVAWDEIWTSFCDLALAGGPPHKGKLLPPVDASELTEKPDAWVEVATEIQRGIFLTTGLRAQIGPSEGWVSITFKTEMMAAWLHRAIMAENIFASRTSHTLHLPAGPNFRLAKEIKNVIVAIAKTFHYLDGHMSPNEQLKAARVMSDSELVEPLLAEDGLLTAEEYPTAAQHCQKISSEALNLPGVPSEDYGWMGFTCEDEKMAAWFVRAAITENILARRQENILFLPVFVPLGKADPTDRVLQIFQRLRKIWDHQKEIGEE